MFCVNVKEVSTTNSVDPDQTAPVGAVWSESTLFAYILKLVNNITARQLFPAEDLRKWHFKMRDRRRFKG